MEIPIHVWVRVALPGGPTYLAFTYVDPQAGLSAKGAVVSDPPTKEQLKRATELPESTFRLPGFPLAVVDAEEVAALGLPAEPPWLELFSPARSSAPWREDPAIAGRFHPQFPDDIQALFFFPAAGKVEQIWVRLSADSSLDRAYQGVMLNTPHSPSELAEGSEVVVRVTPGAPAPVCVGEHASANLERWSGECGECGFDLVLEPVGDLWRRQFPDAPADSTPVSFTTRCALCQGTMVLQRRGEPDA